MSAKTATKLFTKISLSVTMKDKENTTNVVFLHPTLYLSWTEKHTVAYILLFNLYNFGTT